MLTHYVQQHYEEGRIRLPFYRFQKLKGSGWKTKLLKTHQANKWGGRPWHEKGGNGIQNGELAGNYIACKYKSILAEGIWKYFPPPSCSTEALNISSIQNTVMKKVRKVISLTEKASCRKIYTTCSKNPKTKAWTIMYFLRAHVYVCKWIEKGLDKQREKSTQFLKGKKRHGIEYYIQTELDSNEMF